MTLRWIARNLLEDRTALAASVGGVALSLVVVLLVGGMFAGESERIVSYLERAGADVWVMQRGVSNMHMATSLMRGEVVGAVEAVRGVATVTPILNVGAFLEARGGRWYSYVIGVHPEEPRGGPWAMMSGRSLPGPGEVVIPDVLARKAKLGIGSAINALGRTFTIVGISTDTYSMANSVTFVRLRRPGEDTIGSRRYRQLPACRCCSRNVFSRPCRTDSIGGSGGKRPDA
jgi:hypothetical protein